MKVKRFAYVFIGTGPSAISAIVKLLGKGIAAETILWLDPDFKVGDFGSRWQGVPGNTKVATYQKVMQEMVNSLNDFSLSSQLNLDGLLADFTCSLSEAAKPLHALTNHLLGLVAAKKALVTKISRASQGWQIKLAQDKESYLATRVILATGIQPKTLALPIATPQIPLEIVANKQELASIAKQLGRVAVIGSSHSAALASMHLLQCGVEVIQFMKAAYKYAKAIAIDNTETILFDNSGLKGQVAEWIGELIATLTKNQYTGKIKFLKSNEQSLKEYLSLCSHVVFALGVEPRHKLAIEDYLPIEPKHDPKTTIICDGIFGIGAAFPLEVTDAFGVTEQAVGVGKFWFGLSNKILNIWDNYQAISSTHLLTKAKDDSSVLTLSGQGLLSKNLIASEKPELDSNIKAKL